MEWTDTSLADVLKEVKALDYTYEDHWAPHDIEVRELSTATTRKEFARNMGVRFKVAPNVPVADGISAGRNLIRRAWFDSRGCADGLEALRHYRKDWDDKRQVYRNTPRHDWSSHYADAWRMAAVAQNRMGRRMAQTEHQRVSAAF